MVGNWVYILGAHIKKESAYRIFNKSKSENMSYMFPLVGVSRESLLFGVKNINYLFGAEPARFKEISISLATFSRF